MHIKGELKNAQLELFSTADRPTAGLIGRKIYDTGLGLELIDTGTKWILAGGLNADAITVSSFIGETKMMHTFNGLISMPRGWLGCISGSEVTETKYDIVHGSGAYVADGISLSPLNGLWLPDMVDRYAIGANETTNDGTAQMAAVGNVSHEVDIEHTHTSPTHNHKWYESNNGSTDDQTYTSTGGLQDAYVAGTVPENQSQLSTADFDSTLAYKSLPDSYTNKVASTVDGGGNTSLSIKPESHEFMYIMRII